MRSLIRPTLFAAAQLGLFLAVVAWVVGQFGYFLIAAGEEQILLDSYAWRTNWSADNAWYVAAVNPQELSWEWWRPLGMGAEVYPHWFIISSLLVVVMKRRISQLLLWMKAESSFCSEWLRWNRLGPLFLLGAAFIAATGGNFILAAVILVALVALDQWLNRRMEGVS